jgi:nucleolar protein 15
MRSKKTARSKGYGFVQFEDKDVAKIAAEAMNQYLMYGKFMACRLLTDEETNSSQLKRANQRFKFVPWHIIYKNHMNSETKSDEQIHKALKRLVSSDQEKFKQLEKLGIKYAYKTYEQSL